MKYRKKPVVIDAFLFGFHDMPEWFEKELDDGRVYLFSNGKKCWLSTLEGIMEANEGQDYIVMGVDGELYPCKREIFEKTYEEVD